MGSTANFTIYSGAFGDGKVPFGKHVAKAIALYRARTGNAPTLVLVHPDNLDAALAAAGGVEVQAYRFVQPTLIYSGSLDAIRSWVQAVDRDWAAA